MQVVIAGRYRLLELAGSGGMGRVWRARDERLDREVAVKQVAAPPWLAEHERDELHARTLREARTAARLNHPNVVHVYDVVRVDDDPWLVMEYVPSRSLQDIVETDGPLDPRRAAGIGLAVLAALRAAHDAGVLHRDVKPANVLLARDGRVLLTDFGLAVFDGGDGTMTRPGLVLGSPQYVSPERAAEGVSSVEADLWSLGATLHTAVEGRSPYARSTAMATLTALASQPPDPAPHAGPLEPALAGLLHRDPRHRLRHEEAARLLTVAAGSSPVADHGPAGPAGRDGSTGSGGIPEPGDSAGSGDYAEPGDRTGPSSSTRPGDSTGASGSSGPGDSTGPGSSTAPGEAAAAGGRDVPPPDDHPHHRRRAALRRWGLAAAAVVLAVAAGVGTALAVTGTPAGRPLGEPSGEPPPGKPWEHEPARPDPPAGGHGVPPPPFPCIRPHVVGEPVTPGPPPADRTATLPAGWIWYGDGDGFRIAVPAGWRYLRSGNTTCFQDPATRRTLGIEPYLGGSSAPTAQLRASEQYLVNAGRLPGYEHVRLTATGGGAEWECRWTAPYGERLHALRVLPGDGDGWTLGWTTSDADWTAAAPQLAVIRRSFRPDRSTHSAG
ncbi:protein kinase domain-containing protein [Micromonospora sp. SL4-19]|uniref:serine/threonine-protein kinase n=1 Tax=Micromonospora sp. SL4-19 TaxID=3399129 RepID=UPI003A4D4C14